MRLRGVVGATVALGAAMAILTGAAGAAGAATITPSLALTPTSETAAATHDLGTDIKFRYSTRGDTVQNLTLQLPSGLIADASVDGGMCLKSSAPLAGCQVGSGKITATAAVLNLLGIKVPVTETLQAHFDLVAAPASGDLAGLQVLAENPTNTAAGFQPLGSPASVSLRPSDEGLNIAFAGLPSTYPLNVFGLGLGTVPISVSEINGTFDKLRFPSTCPSTAARVTVSANSHDAGVTETSRPLAVTGCGSAPYSPSFDLSATRDADDKQVRLTTTISQAADELTSRSTALAFPSKVLAPNLGVAAALCPAAGSSCQAIGSATAVSPQYPTPLTGVAYLTGSSVLTPDITLVFGPPFSLTLNGAVSLAGNSTSFTGIPDIPLTKLAVTLDGGAAGAFSTTCSGATGAATAKLVSQNGDRAVNDSSKFTVSGWKACPSGGSGGGSGGGGGNGGSGGGGGGSSSGGGGNGGGTSGSGGNGGGGSKSSGAGHHRPTLSGGAVSGLQGHPGLRFVVTRGQGAGKIAAVTVSLGAGLSFVTHHRHGRVLIRGVRIGGATVKSLALAHGHLTIRLARPANRITLKLGRGALRESARRRRAAKHHALEAVQVNVAVRDVKGVVSRLRLRIAQRSG
jgi:hypothetical protein